MGRIDILVNSAGTTKRAPSLEFADEDWNRVLNINLNGTWYACQMVGRVMKEQAYGRIINIASIGAFLSLYEVTAYCASKGAVAMMTRCLGAEWVKYNITVVNASFGSAGACSAGRTPTTTPVMMATIVAAASAGTSVVTRESIGMSNVRNRDT